MLGSRVQKVAEGETEAQEDDVIFPRSTEVLCRGTLQRYSGAQSQFCHVAFSLSTHTSLPISAHRNAKG